MSPTAVDRVRLAPGTVDRMIAEAESWLGTQESPSGSNKVAGVTDWYGLVGPWCAMWISRIFWDGGLPLPASTSKGFAYTPSGANWFKAQGRWKTSNPKRGDVVFFDFPGDSVNRISHVGIVTGVNSDGSINTIEGNTDERGGRTGGKVMRRVRKVGIVGYGTPAYQAASAPSPAPAPAPQPTPTGDLKERIMALPTLTEGAGVGERANQGHYVGIMQSLMGWHGAAPVSSDNRPTGRFDNVTESSLREWQRRTGVLEPDGVCGPKTWAWLCGV